MPNNNGTHRIGFLVPVANILIFIVYICYDFLPWNMDTHSHGPCRSVCLLLLFVMYFYTPCEHKYLKLYARNMARWICAPKRLKIFWVVWHSVWERGCRARQGGRKDDGQQNRRIISLFLLWIRFSTSRVFVLFFGASQRASQIWLSRIVCFYYECEGIFILSIHAWPASPSIIIARHTAPRMTPQNACHSPNNMRPQNSDGPRQDVCSDQKSFSPALDSRLTLYEHACMNANVTLQVKMTLWPSSGSKSYDWHFWRNVWMNISAASSPKSVVSSRNAAVC